MAILAQLTDTGIGKQTVMPTSDVMDAVQKGATVAQLNQQTQAGYQEQAIKDTQMQRAQQLRGVYSQSVDENGQVDPDKLTSNLYSSGFGAEAADFQKQQANNDYLEAHANYMNGIEQTRAKTEQLAEIQKQATTAGSVLYQFNQNNPDLWKHPQTYSPIDTSKPPEQMTQQDYLNRLDRIKNGQELTPQQLASYDAAYANIPDNLKVYLLNPEQFRADPATGIAKMQSLGSQSDKYMTEVQNAFTNTQNKFKESGNIYTEPGELTPKGTIAPATGDITYTEQKRHDIAMEAKDLEKEKDDEKTALTLAQHINSLSASSRTLLGVASTNNMKSDRALLLLQDPNIDVTQKDAAVTDFLSVMKQGSPDEQMLKRGMYGSTYEKGLELAQSVTGQPMQYKDKAVINKLVKMFEGFKSIDNKVVDDNLGVYAAAAKGFISRNSDQWNQMVGAVKSSYTPAPPPSATGGSDKISLAKQALADPDATPAEKAGAQKFLASQGVR